jgi:hypothetical protein
MRMTFLAAVAVAALASLTPAQATTTFVDGHFDSPLTPGAYTTYNQGVNFGGWHSGGFSTSSVDEIGNYWQAPPNDGGSVDLAGNAPGLIYQYFTGTAGTYNVSFYLAGNPDGGDPLKNLSVTLLNNGGLSSINYSFDTTGFTRNNMGWIGESFQFTTLGGTLALQFESTDLNTAFGAVVGGIDVSGVPEPATWAMLLLGFGGIGMMLRARGRKDAAQTA